MRSRNESAAEVLDNIPAIATPLNPDWKLEGIILAASTGDRVAKRMLRPVVYRIALDAVTYVDAAKRVTRYVLGVLGSSTRGPGRPIAGRAVGWLENVVRTFAQHDFQDQSLERWEEWDEPDAPQAAEE
jgi:hypothetical protein